MQGRNEGFIYPFKRVFGIEFRVFDAAYFEALELTCFIVFDLVGVDEVELLQAAGCCGFLSGLCDRERRYGQRVSV